MTRPSDAAPVIHIDRFSHAGARHEAVFDRGRVSRMGVRGHYE
jgi:hypothetical protein